MSPIAQKVAIGVSSFVLGGIICFLVGMQMHGSLMQFHIRMQTIALDSVISHWEAGNSGVAEKWLYTTRCGNFSWLKENSRNWLTSDDETIQLYLEENSLESKCSDDLGT